VYQDFVKTWDIIRIWETVGRRVISMHRSSAPMRLPPPSDYINGCRGTDLVDLAIHPFCDILPELAPIVDQKLIVSVEEWRGLVSVGNGLSGLSPTDIPLVDNRRKKSEKISTSFCLSRILASQTQPGLSNLAQRLCWIAHRTMSCSFHHRKGD